MEIETLKTDILRSKDHRSSDCTLLGFNLPTLVSNMKQSCSWAKGELNALILLKSPYKQIVLTAMHKGTEIKSFQSNDSITFQIIEGILKFHIRKDTITLYKDQVMTLDENIKYSLTTEDETVFLLTISDSVKKASSN